MAKQKVTTTFFSAAVNRSNNIPLIKLGANKSVNAGPSVLSGPHAILDANNPHAEFAPLTNNLLASLGDNEITKTKKAAMFSIVEQLQVLESNNYAQNMQVFTAQKMLAAFEKSDYWKEAKNIVDSITVGNSYSVDITFYPDNTLKSKKIDIRSSGKQHRHVTPIALVEHIILNALQEKANVDSILKSLYSKLECFKLNVNGEDNKLIQGIFDFFKHPDNQTISGISFLIKITAHFYHKKLSLIMKEEGIKTPPIHASYIVPSLKFGGTKYKHKAEGSFVSALLKLLDGMEEELCKGGKSLTALQEKQIVYAIFALFDYLPLPKNAKKIKEMLFNCQKNRYVGEPIERLYDVSANHLHFIFEAYPNLASFYKKKIIKGFLKYVAFGVPIDKLCRLLNCKNKTFLSNKIKIKPAPLKNYTAEGSVRGFSAQYDQNNQNSFLNTLKDNVEKRLSYVSGDYLFELEMSHDKRIDSDSDNDLHLSRDSEENIHFSSAKKLDSPFKSLFHGISLEDLNSMTDSSYNYYDSSDSEPTIFLPPLLNSALIKPVVATRSTSLKKNSPSFVPVTISDDLMIHNKPAQTAPLCDKLMHLLKEEEFTEANKKEMLLAIEKLQAIELADNLQKMQASIAKNMLDSFEKSSYWQEAKKVVESVTISKSYSVDMSFYADNTLKSAKIDIRQSGNQNRHITPVALIERIILNSLQEKTGVDDMFKSLYSKLEVFKLNLDEKDNQLIQGIFDFFKHPDNKTINGISLLIKIIAHLYNKKLSLTMNDDVIETPRINDAYLIPSLEFGGLTYAHENEGSFVSGLLKLLDGMEEKLGKDKKALKPIQIKQMTYAIFALFDYLPLPKDAKKIKGLGFNAEKNRFVGESIERLYEVCANHLHFVFEAYPRLAYFHKKEVVEGFLKYVAFGISPAELCELYNCQNNISLSGKVNLKLSLLKKNYTNEGSVCGFATQYPQRANFFAELKENVKELMSDFSSDYAFELESDSDEKTVSDSSMEFDLRNEKFTAGENLFSSFKSKFLLNASLSDFDGDADISNYNCDGDSLLSQSFSSSINHSFSESPIKHNKQKFTIILGDDVTDSSFSDVSPIKPIKNNNKRPLEPANVDGQVCKRIRFS
jgi:hypothetical protein